MAIWEINYVRVRVIYSVISRGKKLYVQEVKLLDIHIKCYTRVCGGVVVILYDL